MQFEPTKWKIYIFELITHAWCLLLSLRTVMLWGLNKKRRWLKLTVFLCIMYDILLFKQIFNANEVFIQIEYQVEAVESLSLFFFIVLAFAWASVLNFNNKIFLGMFSECTKITFHHFAVLNYFSFNLNLAAWYWHAECSSCSFFSLIVVAQQ